MMKASLSSRITALILASLGSSATVTRAEIKINAEVLSSSTTSSTVRFTFSGDLSGLAPQVNLQAFLFIDFSGSANLENSLPGTANLESFLNNSATTGSGSTVTKVEIRNNEGYYFDRIGFVFNSALNEATTFGAGSYLELELPTTAPITTEDFSELPVYWCFPNWGTNQGRGTLVGLANLIEEVPASIHINRETPGQIALEFTGILESSPDLSAPFSPVIGAMSPYLVPSDSPSRLFYRASAN